MCPLPSVPPFYPDSRCAPYGLAVKNVAGTPCPAAEDTLLVVAVVSDRGRPSVVLCILIADFVLFSPSRFLTVGVLYENYAVNDSVRSTPAPTSCS